MEMIPSHFEGNYVHFLCVGLSIVITPVFVFLFSTESVQLAAAG